MVIRRGGARRRWPTTLTAVAASTCLLLGGLVAAALRANGYDSRIADVAEKSLVAEGFARVERDRDLQARPCRVLAFAQPDDAVSVTGVEGRRQRVEVTVMDTDEPPAALAARLAEGLTACRTADASPFELVYADVRTSGAEVDWRFTARGPTTSTGRARLRHVGSCAVYLSDQRGGNGAVAQQRLDRVEAAVSAGLRSRVRGRCTD